MYLRRLVFLESQTILKILPQRLLKPHSSVIGLFYLVFTPHLTQDKSNENVHVIGGFLKICNFNPAVDFRLKIAIFRLWRGLPEKVNNFQAASHALDISIIRNQESLTFENTHLVRLPLFTNLSLSFFCYPASNPSKYLPSPPPLS